MTFSILDITCKRINLKLIMHEFPLTRNLLQRALKNAGSKQIVRVNLLIGPFSEERETSIQFYWKDLAKGSCGEGAELHFEHMPVEVKCLDCTGAFYLDEEGSLCEFCYDERQPLLSGEDVKLESIELE
jgi:hydrogenase nickel incorporation protein HypA/HybF